MTRIMSFLVICLAILSISFKTTDPVAESIKRGKDIYSVSCVACHQADGKGMENIFPPLNYVRNSWGNKGDKDIVKPEEVKKARSDKKKKG